MSSDDTSLYSRTPHSRTPQTRTPHSRTSRRRLRRQEEEDRFSPESYLRSLAQRQTERLRVRRKWKRTVRNEKNPALSLAERIVISKLDPENFSVQTTRSPEVQRAVAMTARPSLSELIKQYRRIEAMEQDLGQSMLDSVHDTQHHMKRVEDHVQQPISVEGEEQNTFLPEEEPTRMAISVQGEEQNTFLPSKEPMTKADDRVQQSIIVKGEEQKLTLPAEEPMRKTDEHMQQPITVQGGERNSSVSRSQPHRDADLPNSSRSETRQSRRSLDDEDISLPSTSAQTDNGSPLPDSKGDADCIGNVPKTDQQNPRSPEIDVNNREFHYNERANTPGEAYNDRSRKAREEMSHATNENTGEYSESPRGIRNKQHKAPVQMQHGQLERQTPVSSETPPQDFKGKERQTPVSSETPPQDFKGKERQTPVSSETPPQDFKGKERQTPVSSETPPQDMKGKERQTPVSSETPPQDIKGKERQTPVSSETPPQDIKGKERQTPVSSETPPQDIKGKERQTPVSSETPPQDIKGKERQTPVSSETPPQDIKGKERQTPVSSETPPQDIKEKETVATADVKGEASEPSQKVKGEESLGQREVKGDDSDQPIQVTGPKLVTRKELSSQDAQSSEEERRTHSEQSFERNERLVHRGSFPSQEPGQTEALVHMQYNSPELSIQGRDGTGQMDHNTSVNEQIASPAQQQQTSQPCSETALSAYAVQRSSEMETAKEDEDTTAEVGALGNSENRGTASTEASMNRSNGSMHPSGKQSQQSTANRCQENDHVIISKTRRSHDPLTSTKSQNKQSDASSSTMPNQNPNKSASPSVSLPEIATHGKQDGTTKAAAQNMTPTQTSLPSIVLPANHSPPDIRSEQGENSTENLSQKQSSRESNGGKVRFDRSYATNPVLTQKGQEKSAADSFESGKSTTARVDSYENSESRENTEAGVSYNENRYIKSQGLGDRSKVAGTEFVRVPDVMEYRHENSTPDTNGKSTPEGNPHLTVDGQRTVTPPLQEGSSSPARNSIQETRPGNTLSRTNSKQEEPPSAELRQESRPGNTLNTANSKQGESPSAELRLESTPVNTLSRTNSKQEEPPSAELRLESTPVNSFNRADSKQQNQPLPEAESTQEPTHPLSTESLQTTTHLKEIETQQETTPSNSHPSHSRNGHSGNNSMASQAANSENNDDKSYNSAIAGSAGSPRTTQRTKAEFRSDVSQSILSDRINDPREAITRYEDSENTENNAVFVAHEDQKKNAERRQDGGTHKADMIPPNLLNKGSAENTADDGISVTQITAKGDQQRDNRTSREATSHSSVRSENRGEQNDEDIDTNETKPGVVSRGKGEQRSREDRRNPKDEQRPEKSRRRSSSEQIASQQVPGERVLSREKDSSNPAEPSTVKSRKPLNSNANRRFDNDGNYADTKDDESADEDDDDAPDDRIYDFIGLTRERSFTLPEIVYKRQPKVDTYRPNHYPKYKDTNDISSNRYPNYKDIKAVQPYHYPFHKDADDFQQYRYPVHKDSRQIPQRSNDNGVKFPTLACPLHKNCSISSVHTQSKENSFDDKGRNSHSPTLKLPALKTAADVMARSKVNRRSTEFRSSDPGRVKLPEIPEFPTLVGSAYEDAEQAEERDHRVLGLYQELKTFNAFSRKPSSLRLNLTHRSSDLDMRIEWGQQLPEQTNSLHIQYHSGRPAPAQRARKTSSESDLKLPKIGNDSNTPKKFRRNFSQKFIFLDDDVVPEVEIRHSGEGFCPDVTWFIQPGMPSERCDAGFSARSRDRKTRAWESLKTKCVSRVSIMRAMEVKSFLGGPKLKLNLGEAKKFHSPR